MSFLNKQPIPYLYSRNEDEFICYDDVESIIFKTNYANANNLGGISLFSLDFDDFTGKFCMSGKFPLLQAAKDSLLDTKDYNEDPFFIEENPNNIENSIVTFYS